MYSKLQKFVKILKIEVDDIIRDLKFLNDVTAERLKAHEITTYVGLENMGLIHHEIAGFEYVEREMESFEVGDSVSLQNIQERVEKLIRDAVEKSDLPEAVFQLLERKIAKVRQYLEIED